ncbi:hypothetical protein QFZ78_003557 [Paenibacillus sp. V4I5]|nr:hypothetical protein [Paenibacillus sp. V4I5]
MMEITMYVSIAVKLVVALVGLLIMTHDFWERKRYLSLRHLILSPP